MKLKITLLLCGISLLYGNSDVSVYNGIKDYSNSKTKVDGKTFNINLSYEYENGKISLGYLKDDVNRVHPQTNAEIDLHVEKYNAKYKYFINQKLNLKASYISIIDNRAPTNQGKIYGIGAGYKLEKGFGTRIDFYRSDYKPFNVNQYDLSVYKGFKAEVLKKTINWY